MIPHSRPSIGPEETAAVSRVLESGRLAQGAQVEAFEHECAASIGRKHGVAVSSGTAAIHLALGALGVGKHEPVAIPSYGCAALITATLLQQAWPALCDVADDYNLVPSTVPDDCRVGIVPHLFGARAAMPEIQAIVEDIAQSMSQPNGHKTAVAITSFYATKLITTGEGGMLLTDEDGIADYARDRRDYDNRDEFVVRHPYKMTDFQAALGRVQLRRLPEFLERRRAIAARYADGLSGMPLRLPVSVGHVFFRYVVATDQRDALEAHLRASGIEAKRPVYRPAHHYLGGEFPRSQRAHERCLSLPIYPSMSDAEAGHVIESVGGFFGNGHAGRRPRVEQANAALVAD